MKKADRLQHGCNNPSAEGFSDELESLWIGSIGGIEEELVMRADVPFESIPAAGVHGVGLRALPNNLWQIGRGLLQSRQILRRYKPDVIFFTGGYLAVPMALARQVLPISRAPVMLYVPDIEPGLALKTLARFAHVIAITADETRMYFPRHPHVIVTGYPTRSELGTWTRETARQALRLAPGLLTLLVFGGSKGAHSINRALLAALHELLTEIQVVHISGKADWSQVIKVKGQLPESLTTNYFPYPYLHNEMGAALCAADLALSRAGAATLGEFPLFGLPAILVPYPHAWRYQQVNAEYLARRKAAIILADSDLDLKLSSFVRSIIQDTQKLRVMRHAMETLAKPQAAGDLANLLIDLAIRRQRAL